jgi:hypothetical protein
LPDDAKNEKPYYDVDGDNNVIAADVLDVIKTTSTPAARLEAKPKRVFK